MDSYDVAVVGAGLSGLVCARELARRGAAVLLLDQKTDLARGVHTTGIFVRRTLEDFAFPAGCLGEPVRHVTLYSPRRRRLELASERDEFRIGRMARLYSTLLDEAREAGAVWSPRTRLVGIDGNRLALERGRRAAAETRAGFVVGADGIASRVARGLGLDTNRAWIVGIEDVLRDVPLDGPPRLHCFVDPALAPGYIAWLAHDSEELHIGVGGYARHFDPVAALARFRAGVGDLVDLRRARRIQRRAGRIPVGGLLPRIACGRGLLVGDASGAVSPLTAGGLDPCLRQSHMAVRAIAAFLGRGDFAALADYQSPALRARFRSRRALRRAFATLPSPAVTELAFAALRLPGFRLFARRLFFGRGSFPDPTQSTSSSFGPAGRGRRSHASHWA